uniref:Uncharacterized protein n=1 Tax=Magallana gigas TaxID=29159 RepID=K1Q8M6_MAGGI
MSGERAWDPWKTFKLSDAERDLIDRRRQTKDRFRIEFNKIYTDPRKDYVVSSNFLFNCSRGLDEISGENVPNS